MLKNNDGGRLGQWIVLARKTLLVERLKRFIPQKLRRLAWQTAVSSSYFNVLGSRLFIPAGARNKSLLLDAYEPAVTACMRSILREKMTFCDVGANIGVFTLFAARLIGRSGRVVALEPIPENLQVLRSNIALNGCTNVTVLENAVAESNGLAEIHLSSLCGCHSLVAQPDGSVARTLSVRTIRLDGIPGLTEIDLLKIDAEGAELSVLRSLGALRPKHLILEYNNDRTKAAGYTGAQFLEVLRDMGYTEIQNLDDPALGLESIETGKCASTNLYAPFGGKVG